MKRTYAHIKRSITGAPALAAAVLAMICAGCARYDDVARNLDFLRFEYFTCSVVRVDSGESFLCQLSDMSMDTIRLNGIDVPEQKLSEAKKFSESILRRGTLVKVEPDRESVDTSGGPQSYVFVPGGKMLNVLLVENGYAIPVPGEVNDKYKGLFSSVQPVNDMEGTDTGSNQKSPWLK